MKFKLKAIKKPVPADKDLKLAHAYTDAIIKELKGFVKSVVFFGSRAKPGTGKKGDLDILIIFDDLPDRINPEVIRGYLLITQKIAKKMASNIHLTHMPLTEFWEYVRKGDSIITNIIREGIATHDPGFFQPAKALLRRGKIKPSSESINFYKHRGPASLQSADWKLRQACLDLYWAVIDAAHAALMHHNQVPVNPEQVSGLLQETFAAKGTISKNDVATVQRFWQLQDDIHRNRVRKVTGQQYEALYKEADGFVQSMKQIIEVPHSSH